MRLPIRPLILTSALVILAAAPALSVDATAADFDHSAWDQILQTYVNDQGRVAYKDLAAKDKPKLEAYLKAVASADPSKMSPKEAEAFYINAYNASVFKGILGGGSAESVLSRISFFGTTKYSIGGKETNLNDLEKKIIRPTFKDPRVHFALVCASSSCPKLNRHAYTAETVDAMLEAQGKDFLGDRFKNPLGPGPEVELSMIFKWYEEDFVAAKGSVAAFIGQYVGTAAPACLKTNGCKFKYATYDWTMNAQPGQRPS